VEYKLRNIVVILMLFVASKAGAGPYTEAGVNGYIGNDNRHANPLSDSDAVVNPIFRGWATSYKDYLPSDTQWSGNWNNPGKALGPVTGQLNDIVSLGDLDDTEIADGCKPGRITLVFGNPHKVNDSNHIRNVKGYDFVIFENGFISGSYDTSGGPVTGQMFADLGYVEVSSDGNNFVRFPSVSLTSEQVDPYGTIDISNIYNLGGKHPNSYGICVGTPFDLSEIANEPNVVNGLVDINNICYVRIVDIPGSGDFYDNAVKQIDADSWPNWQHYSHNHPIYDAWPTWGSGGFDLEAIGVLKEQQYSADINLDGVVDFADLSLFASAWLSHFGDENWIGRCDLAQPKDRFINFKDFAVFASQWHKKENWRR
jgi:hypothetical protein